jgi:hypothetical protein
VTTFPLQFPYFILLHDEPLLLAEGSLPASPTIGQAPVLALPSGFGQVRRIESQEASALVRTAVVALLLGRSFNQLRHEKLGIGRTVNCAVHSTKSLPEWTSAFFSFFFLFLLSYFSF